MHRIMTVSMEGRQNLQSIVSAIPIAVMHLD
jgi:hypothetical protein